MIIYDITLLYNVVKSIRWLTVCHGINSLRPRDLYIHVYQWTRTDSDHGLLPVWYQCITWTNEDLLSVWHSGKPSNQIWIEIWKSSFKKMLLKMWSAKWQPYCSGPKVLKCFVFAIFSTTEVVLDSISYIYNSSKRKTSMKLCVIALCFSIVNFVISHIFSLKVTSWTTKWNQC